MTALADALEHVQTAVIAAYDVAEVTDAPTRIYVSPGDPPADCELVGIWGVPQAKPTATTGPGAVAARCAVIHQAAITIRGWLCVPTGTPPEEAALQAAGIRLADHQFAVWRHLVTLALAKTLIPGSTDCGTAQTINASQIFPEQGAFVGWQLELLVDLTPLLNTEPSS